jgi:broad specificity phosphatase PhoE
VLPKGIPTLERIGKYLKDIHTQKNFVSPFIRCLDSAKIIGRISGKKFIVDDRIRELENNGEKFTNFRSRVSDFVADIERKNYSAISICTHGAVIAALKHLLTKRKFYFFQVIDYPDPGNLTIIKNGKVETMNFNQ